MPLNKYFTSRRREQRASAPAHDESDATQIGRDDAKAFVFTCPFEAGSDDAQEWATGQQLESGRK